MKDKDSQKTPKKVPLEDKTLDRVVSELSAGQKPIRVTALREVFRAAVKLAKESPGTLNLKIASTVMKELRYSFKMFYPDRHVPKITIFGSARTPPTKASYKLAKSFAKESVDRGYKIITGGGPGVMAAGNEGAGVNGSFGLNIRLPHEQNANEFIDQKKSLIHFKYFFTRKLFLVKEASAFAMFPGGFGTLDETFELLTLIQTGKNPLIPVVFMEPKTSSYWKNFVEFLENDLMTRKFISPNDRHLYTICHDPKSALDYIDQFYRVYHSMRIVKERMAMRLKKRPSDKLLGEINRKFKKIPVKGKFTLSGPLPEERNEPELKDLTRLVFEFDRMDFCGLRPLIDFINLKTV